ncbi:MAG TPA: hypothetical protein VGF97_15575 [Rhizomicrobium sp.]
MDYLTTAANVAAILTAISAAAAWVYYIVGQQSKRRKLESYLRSEKSKGADKGQRTVLHLMVRVGLTEDEILQASFRSRHIKRLIATDPKTNRAEAILLAYDEGG